MSIHLIKLQIMAELLAAEHMFAWFLAHKEKYPLRLALSAALCLAAAYFFPVPDGAAHSYIGYGSVMFLFIFLVSGISVITCYDEDFWGILFVCVTGYTVQHLASSLNYPTAALLHSEAAGYLVSLAATYIISFLVFSKDIRRSGKIHVDNKRMLILSIAALTVDIFAGLVIAEINSEATNNAFRIVSDLLNALACPLILSIQFGLLSNKSLEIELGIVSQMLQEREKQFEASRDNIDIINQKCHDLRHQIRTLRKGAAVVDGAALKEIEKAVAIYDAAVKTGNGALDVILTEKSLLCEKNGIILTCMADGGIIDFMAPGDVYSLFGNALDNAMEAVGRISEPERRSIGLSLRQKGMMVSIHVENCFEGSLSFEDGLPQTSKEDKSYHGFGMKSMQTIAEKYGGFLTASTKSGVFNLDIVIPKK